MKSPRPRTRKITDKDRLDWLEKNYGFMSIGYNPRPRADWAVIRVSLPGMGEWLFSEKTVRSVIDSAIRSQRRKG